jgi:NhaP-type Na+/H+ or K+/H+ antiporter
MPDVEGGERLWAIVGLIILISILMHGITVTPVMRMLDRSQGRDPDVEESTPPPGLQGPAVHLSPIIDR